MIDDAREEQAALYALGLLEPDAEAAFETELSADAELRALVRELRDSAALLSLTIPQKQPSALVFARVLAAMRAEREASPQTTRSLAWLPWALAAAFAILASFLGFERSRMNREIVTLRTRDALSSIRIATLTAQIDSANNSVGAVAWDAEKQRGVLAVSGMPQPGGDQDYQLWVIDPDHPQPVSGGLVPVDTAGNARVAFSAAVPIKKAQKFAISKERKGGAPTAEGPIIMLSNQPVPQ